ncbi:MAG: AIR synthase related protein [Desulfurococcales archaeon]|nr:AIR synthase related protein [Desulfurococcales archaeon]
MSEHEFIYRLLRELSIPDADAYYESGWMFKVDGYSAEEALYPWMSLEDLGWKAVTSAISDVYSSGGLPVFYLASIGVGSRENAEELTRGIREAVGFYGGKLVGGDTNRCSCDAWIDVFAVGKSLAGRLLDRSGGSPGDAVIQLGSIGLGSAAYYIYKEGLSVEDFPSVMGWSVRPVIPSWIPYVVSHKCVRAVIDNSDGFLYSLRFLAEGSGVGLVVSDLWFDEEALSVADGDWRKLSVGEDYNLFLLVSNDCVDDFLGYCSGFASGMWACRVVGLAGKGEPGVVLSGFEGSGGWESF